MHVFLYVCSFWLALCGWTFVHFDRDREFSSNFTLPKERHYLVWPASTAPLSLYISLSTKVTSDPPPPIARLSVTVKKSFNMPAFINHSDMFPLGAWNALSVYMPALLTSWSFCASSLSLYTQLFIHLSLLFDFVFAPPWMIVVEKNMNCCWIKGTQQRWVWFGTLLMWFCMFHKPGKSLFFTLFECLWSYVCVCVNPYACEHFFCHWSHVCVCVLCYERDYFESTYPITQRIGRMPSERNSRSSVCTLYDSSCLCVFLPYVKCYLFFFSLSLSLSFSLWLLWGAAQYFWAGVSYYKTVVPLETVNF